MKYYPFELHCHTCHSDGSFTPEELVKAAKERGLAGIALTDHNTASGVEETVEYGKKYGILVIPGIEWTTFFGHITVLGGHSAVNWTTVTAENVIEKIKQARSAGDVAVLAHPYRVGYPVCTGGMNEFPQEIFALIDGYEAVSEDVDTPTNRRQTEEYLQLIKQGYRIAAVYGRDWHRPSNIEYAVTELAIEGALNVENALEAIRRGRTAIIQNDRETGAKRNSNVFLRSQVLKKESIIQHKRTLKMTKAITNAPILSSICQITGD